MNERRVMTNYEELCTQLRDLALVEETGDPFLSVSVDLSDPGARLTLLERFRTIRQTCSADERSAVEQAMGRIEGYLETAVSRKTRGVVLHCREGAQPFFRSLEFEVPVTTEARLDTLPCIWLLVSLKDNFSRYVVLISSEEGARILEVSLGQVTRQLWTERPELRKRVGREWTRQHYQNHRRNRNEQFMKEKIRVLEKVMASGGHNHLILAGNPANIARLSKLLPQHLRERLVDLVPADARTPAQDVVELTIASFVEEEERESQSVAARLRSELRSGGLAVAGLDACEQVLERGQADVLVIGEPGTAPDPARMEGLVRLAERTGAQVEVVKDTEPLAALGGVGCLLRYSMTYNEELQAQG